MSTEVLDRNEESDIKWIIERALYEDGLDDEVMKRLVKINGKLRYNE